MTKHKVILLTVENVAIWGGVGLAVSMALPYIQALAGLLASIYTLLSIARMIKYWNVKDTKDGKN